MLKSCELRCGLKVEKLTEVESYEKRTEVQSDEKH